MLRAKVTGAATPASRVASLGAGVACAFCVVSPANAGTNTAADSRLNERAWEVRMDAFSVSSEVGVDPGTRATLPGDQVVAGGGRAGPAEAVGAERDVEQLLDGLGVDRGMDLVGG